MRIGIDCRMYSSNFTGIGRYVYELVKNLREIDGENEYVLFFNDPEFAKFNDDSGRFKKVLVNAKHYSFAEQIKFLRMIIKEKIDVMHFTHFNAPVLYGCPTVVTIHDLTLHFFPGKKMNNLFYKLAYKFCIKTAVLKARKVIAVSKNTKVDIKNILKIDEKKVEVIYEGVNDSFKPVNDKILLGEVLKKYGIEKEYLIYTGVWREHKNILGLIEAFSKLKSDVVLVITGKEDKFYSGEIYKLIDKLGMKNRVIFTGLVSEEELVLLMGGAKVFVFPSFYEGFGLPPLEAMQCEVPVVSSVTSSMKEICFDAAEFFNPHDTDEMAKKMELVINDENVRKKLIENGKKRVKEFSWEKMAGETLEVYKKAHGTK